MNEEEIKLLNKIEELPRELNIEIRGLILAEICLRKENQQLKEQLHQFYFHKKEDIINKAIKFVKDYKTEWTLNDEVLNDMNKLLEILDNKGE